jgi:hypothetical protein
MADKNLLTDNNGLSRLFDQTLAENIGATRPIGGIIQILSSDCNKR